MDSFRELLWNVNDAYDDFVAGVISYVKMPGNENKRVIIEDFIKNNPGVESSEITKFILEKTGFWETNADYIPSGRPDILAAK